MNIVWKILMFVTTLIAYLYIAGAFIALSVYNWMPTTHDILLVIMFMFVIIEDKLDKLEN